jgi:hypothetical protein
MNSSQDLEWLDRRLRERAELSKKKRLAARNPAIPAIDASKFTRPLLALAETLTYKVEREGPRTIRGSSIPVDAGIILRQLMYTYNLLLFINADDTRIDNYAYHHTFSFVALPLVRTMIDGFYNCTAMLDDPSRSRVFRISGYYRMREALVADEAKYSSEPSWQEFLEQSRLNLDGGMKAENITNADLDNKANRWPLLGEYLGRQPETPHKQLLRKMTLGFWKEYSSISHASFDALVSLFPFVARDRIPLDQRDGLLDVDDRNIAMHLGRASGVLAMLLTEFQHFYKFAGHEIDQRLAQIWAALIPMAEVRELYEYRYKEILR